MTITPLTPDDIIDMNNLGGGFPDNVDFGTLMNQIIIDLNAASVGGGLPDPTGNAGDVLTVSGAEVYELRKLTPADILTIRSTSSSTFCSVVVRVALITTN